MMPASLRLRHHAMRRQAAPGMRACRHCCATACCTVQSGSPLTLAGLVQCELEALAALVTTQRAEEPCFARAPLLWRKEAAQPRQRKAGRHIRRCRLILGVQALGCRI